jgi:predicted dehydrogenase
VAEKLRLGMVGTGINVGEGAVYAATRILDTTDVRVVCDASPRVLARVRERYGIRDVTSSYEDVLARTDLDAIYLGTPAQQHGKQVLAALESGRHVYVEKPLAYTMDECRRIIDLAEAKKLKVLVGMNQRAIEYFRGIKALADAGDLGALFFVQWDYIHDIRYLTKPDSPMFTPARVDPNDPANTLLEAACHPIDMVMWLAGMVDEVHAIAVHGVLPNLLPSDCVSMQLRFRRPDVAGRVLMNLGMIGPHPRRRGFHAYGTLGSVIPEGIYLDRMNPNYMGWGNPSTAQPYVLEDHWEELGVEPPTPFRREPDDPYHVDGHLYLIPHFIECIREDRTPLVDPRENARMIAVCAAVVESIGSGLPVKVGPYYRQAGLE